MMFNIFVILGVIHLLLMLRTDMKYMRVDSRHNWFMMGVVSFMFLSNYPGFFIMIGLFLISFFLGFALKKYSGFGDVEMGTWAIVGFGTLNLVWTPIYVFWIAVIRLIYHIPMKRTGTKKLPGTPVFFASFILTAACGYFLDLLVYGVL